MSKTLVTMFASLVLMGAFVWMMFSGESAPRRGAAAIDPSSDNASSSTNKQSNADLMVFCAASNQAVMESIRREYESETGRTVTIQYGGSQTLLAQLEITGQGDLYLPADDSYLTLAKEKRLIDEVLPIARMQCGAAVRKGNPLAVKDLTSMMSSEVQLVQASPEATAIGKLVRQLLTETGQWQPLADATEAFRGTIIEVVNDITVGAADVGIVYDAVLHPYPDLEFIPIPELEEVYSQVSIGVLNSSANPSAALHFARFITAADRGLKHYENHGFRVADGDQWSDRPELTVFAGSMLRPAIEDTIIAFEQREGVAVTRVYNGCGILVAQMQGGQQPDAYFACDREFMEQVKDLFPVSTDVSQNELVIIVQKGNPHQIASLRDLTKPGLRVGVGHEKQCAMGWITQNVFREAGMRQELMANVTVQTPTGDMLVNQLRTGSLDAAVVYLSNAAGSGEYMDAVQIQGIPCSTATQPWAVAEKTAYPQLAGRLFAKICSTESQEVFSAEGFRWQLSPNNAP